MEKVGECFFHASGILDANPRHFQPQNGKAHRHAVIIVRFDVRAVEFRREHFERIAILNHRGATFGQFVAQRCYALAFLDTQAAQIRELHWQSRERGHDDGRHDTVTQIDSTRVATEEAFLKALARKSPDDTVKLSVNREGGEKVELSVRLAAKPVY